MGEKQLDPAEPCLGGLSKCHEEHKNRPAEPCHRSGGVTQCLFLYITKLEVACYTPAVTRTKTIHWLSSDICQEIPSPVSCFVPHLGRAMGALNLGDRCPDPCSSHWTALPGPQRERLLVGSDLMERVPGKRLITKR